MEGLVSLLDQGGVPNVPMAELAGKYVPDFVTKIREVNPTDLETTMKSLVNMAVFTNKQGGNLTELLGQIAVVMLLQNQQCQALSKELMETKDSLARNNQQLTAHVTALEESQTWSDDVKLRATPSDREEELTLAYSDLDKARGNLYEQREELAAAHTELNKTIRDLSRSEYQLEQATREIRNLKSEIFTLNRNREKAKGTMTFIQSQLTAAQTEIHHMMQQDISEQEKSLKREQEDPPTVCVTEAPADRTNRVLKDRSLLTSHVPQLLQQQCGRLMSEPPDQCHTPEKTKDACNTYPDKYESNNRLSIKDLDRIARNMTRFEPKFDGATKIDTKTYLNDVDFYLRRFPHATVEDRIYLIKLTSSRDVSSFIERQPCHIKADYDLLCQTLIEEFSDHLHTGLTEALAVMQAPQESPQAYYCRLRNAYFGTENQPDMEEDVNFKSLFIQNLHPTTSYHLGIAACPLTQKSNQLRELAMRAFMKHKQSMINHREPTTVLNLELKDSKRLSLDIYCQKPKTEPRHIRIRQQNLKCRDTQPSDLESEQDPFYANKPKTKFNFVKGGHYTEEVSKKNHQSENSNRHSIYEMFSPQEKQTTEFTETFSFANLSDDCDSLIEQMQDTDSKVELLALAPSNYQANADSSNQQPKNVTMGHEAGTEISEPIMTETLCLPAKACETEPRDCKERASTQSRALLVSSKPELQNDKALKRPFKRLLCNLNEKGPARKLYMPTIIENVLKQEAILDTAADISVMSFTVFDQLQKALSHSKRHVKCHSCTFEIQPYADTQVVLTKMAFIRLTIGPMTVVHPFFVSPLDSVPLLIGKDLLNRFNPIIDFETPAIWTQVQKPLSYTASHCQNKAAFSAPKTVPDQLDYKGSKTGFDLTQNTSWRPQINVLCTVTAPKDHLCDLKQNRESQNSLKTLTKQSFADDNRVRLKPKPILPSSVHPEPTRPTLCGGGAARTPSVPSSTPSSFAVLRLSNLTAGLCPSFEELHGPATCLIDALPPPPLTAPQKQRGGGVLPKQDHKFSSQGHKCTQAMGQAKENRLSTCTKTCDRRQKHRAYLSYSFESPGSHSKRQKGQQTSRHELPGLESYSFP